MIYWISVIVAFFVGLTSGFHLGELNERNQMKEEKSNPKVFISTNDTVILDLGNGKDIQPLGKVKGVNAVEWYPAATNSPDFVKYVEQVSKIFSETNNLQVEQ